MNLVVGLAKAMSVEGQQRPKSPGSTNDNLGIARQYSLETGERDVSYLEWPKGMSTMGHEEPFPREN